MRNSDLIPSTYNIFTGKSKLKFEEPMYGQTKAGNITNKQKGGSKLIFQKSNNTIRLMPQNFWVASIRNEKLIFDSFDGQTKKLLETAEFKNEVIKFFQTLTK